MNGAQWLVRTLEAKGVRYVFVLCGNGLNAFLDACMETQIKVIDVRNEQSAAYMADLWGRFTGSLGVAAVSSGPGHTNAITGLANSWWDGGPMMLISGSSANHTRGRDHFQELDQVAMVAPVSKYAARVDSIENLPPYLHNALVAAVSARPGPVHLTIPDDVLRAPMKASRACWASACVAPQGEGDPALVREAVQLLSRAKRPVMVIGTGAFYARSWPAIKRFSELTQIPIYSLLWDRGCIEESIPQYVGIVSTEVNPCGASIAEADLIFTLGARVDYRMSFGEPPMVGRDARFIRVDADPAEVNRGVMAEVGIVGSPRAVLEQMIDAARDMRWEHGAWLRRVRQRREAGLRFWLSRPEEERMPISSLRLCREVGRFLRNDVTFLLDGGNIGRWAHLLLFDRHPGHWLTCGASGVVGWGVPGAVAAKLARPERPVLLLSGDGAAGFTLGDIETALRFNTPYVAVVAHDGAWGIVADGQRRPCASLLGEIRFDRVARAFGARGVFISHPAQLGPAIQQALKAKKVTFIHVPILRGGIGAWRRNLGQR